MERHLIINADDFGMCRAANTAVFELLKCGGITSSTIMAPCSWAPEAVKFAKENPQFAIGVHLTFTSEWNNYRWTPVGIKNTSSLRDSNGYMYKGCTEFENKADTDEVEAEIRAQIAWLCNLGLEPSHLDNHMGSLYGIEAGRLEFLNLFIDMAAEYNLPMRLPLKYTEEQMDLNSLGIEIDIELIKTMFAKFADYGMSKKVAMPDYLIPGSWSGEQKESYDNYKKYMYDFLSKLPEGITETYIHPAIECDELKGTSSVWIRRVWEFKLFSDPETRKFIESQGIKLINYRDLREMRKF